MKTQQRFISYIASPAVQAFLWGGNSNFLILESLLKMSPHCRHIRPYTTRIYALPYANHICNGIFPLFCSGHFICLSKILGRGMHIPFGSSRNILSW